MTLSLSKDSFATPPRKSKAKDNTSLSEPISFRVENGTKRKIDEILVTLRKEGSAISTPSDICRWAVETAVEWLSEQISAPIEGEEAKSSWLKDDIELDRLDRQIDEQLAVEKRISDQLSKLKDFCRNRMAMNDYETATLAMDRLAASIVNVSDGIWKATMRGEVKKDRELREYQKTLSEHGYFTHLYNYDVSAAWEG